MKISSAIMPDAFKNVTMDRSIERRVDRTGSARMMPIVWVCAAALAAAATIVLHEIAHYLGALVMGASDIKLHWADVTYAPGSLAPVGEIVTWAAGPVLTHGIILAVWFGRATGLMALSLGVGACTRDILLLPFTLKALLGRDVSGFSGDEVVVAGLLGISALPFALFAVILGVTGLVIFLKRAVQTRGSLFAAILCLGVVLGIVLWGVIGPMILPGGKGFG